MEQFLYGLFQDGNYVLMKSDGVNQLLTDVNIQYLRQRQHSSDEPFWLPSEQVVALQYISTVKDYTEHNGIWNSTLLIPIYEYIRVTNPYELFKDYFIHTEEQVPTHLPSVRL